MKKSPGRKERRRVERQNRHEEGKKRAHMHLVEQRKLADRLRKEAKKLKKKIKEAKKAS